MSFPAFTDSNPSESVPSHRRRGRGSRSERHVSWAARHKFHDPVGYYHTRQHFLIFQTNNSHAFFTNFSDHRHILELRTTQFNDMNNLPHFQSLTTGQGETF